MRHSCRLTAAKEIRHEQAHVFSFQLRCFRRRYAEWRRFGDAGCPVAIGVTGNRARTSEYPLGMWTLPVLVAAKLVRSALVWRVWAAVASLGLRARVVVFCLAVQS